MRIERYIIGLTIALIFTLVFSSCGDKSSGDPTIPPGTTTYKMGDTGPGGGKIFYVNEAGFTFYQTANDTVGVIAHYLEAAPTDNAGTLAWASGSFTNRDITGLQTGLGTGLKNTLLIVAIDTGSNYAAKVCKDYNGGVKTDWFLPSNDELKQLINNKAYVDGIITGGGMGGAYWSSSQVSSIAADILGSGLAGDDNKNALHNVRAVRAF